MSVAVIGCGPIGLMLIQAARAAGASSVIAADPLPHRREPPPLGRRPGV